MLHLVGLLCKYLKFLIVMDFYIYKIVFILFHYSLGSSLDIDYKKRHSTIIN